MLVYGFVFLLSLQFYEWILNSTYWWSKMLLNFALLWILVLVGFSFFQIFKYFRFPKFTYKRMMFESQTYFSILLVPAFQQGLIKSFFRYLNPRVYLKGRGREYIKIYHEETKQSESSHVLSGTAAFVFQVLLFQNGDYVSFAFLTFYNVLFNLYPLLLQRMNRFALERKLPKMFSAGL